MTNIYEHLRAVVFEAYHMFQHADQTLAVADEHNLDTRCLLPDITSTVTKRRRLDTTSRSSFLLPLLIAVQQLLLLSIVVEAADGQYAKKSHPKGSFSDSNKPLVPTAIVRQQIVLSNETDRIGAKKAGNELLHDGENLANKTMCDHIPPTYFEYEVLATLTGRPDDLSQAQQVEIENLFMTSYNNLSSEFCGSGTFRVLTSVSISSWNQTDGF